VMFASSICRVDRIKFPHSWLSFVRQTWQVTVRVLSLR
jgi:hypothetical protein